METDPCQSLKAELLVASGALKSHMASWEYAFAMAGGCSGARDHPSHKATRARTAQLVGRYRDLRAQLSEHEL
jgi:hypothetical protein